MRRIGVAALTVVVAASGGCNFCRDWTVSPGTTDLDRDQMAALASMKDSSCTESGLVLVPLVISTRHQVTSSEGDAGSRHSLREDLGILCDLAIYKSNESEYGADGRVLEWRTSKSVLGGIFRWSDAGAPGSKGTSTFSVLGGLLGRESHEGRKSIYFLWLPLGSSDAKP